MIDGDGLKWAEVDTAPRVVLVRPQDTVVDDGLGAARGCLFVAGLVALVVVYLVAIN